MNKNNFFSALAADFYEFTMINGYLKNNSHKKTIYFDMFFRNIPDNGGFAIMAGLKQLIEYIENINFSPDDIEFLAQQQIFDDNFLNCLRSFKFSGSIWAIPEGTPIFPQEPILIVKGNPIETQIIETIALNIINHQSLIATKSNRIVRAAGGKPVFEFGARRAHGMDSALFGSRAAFIGGCDSTSFTLAGKKFSIPISGTMAHSWVQLFDSELEAFRTYARTYPENCFLLIDTYNTLNSGIKNAITVFNEELLPRGYRPAGVRIDSGDLTYLSKKLRKILDESGFPDCKICVSNSLDEYIIRDMLMQGAKVDCFGVGEKLITSASSPIFNGVYKVCAIEENNNIISKIKISENVSKITNPGFKNVFRLFDNGNHKAIADIITSNNETIDPSKPYKIFDPEHTWKHKTIKNFSVKNLLKPIFINGERVYNSPDINSIKNFCKRQIDTLWDEVTRFENPHQYYVDLSAKLWEEKRKLLSQKNF